MGFVEDVAKIASLLNSDGSISPAIEHSNILNRNIADQHNIGSITGLSQELNLMMRTLSYDSNSDGKVNAADAADSVPWTGIQGKPATYPPDTHNHDALYEPKNVNIQSHITDTANPHGVTKTQVGLSNVDNTADATKNVLTATKLTTPKTISIDGTQTGSTSFDGSSDVVITLSNVAAQLLADLKTVDGSGSGLDADLLDGKDSDQFFPYTKEGSNSYTAKQETAGDFRIGYYNSGWLNTIHLNNGSLTVTTNASPTEKKVWTELNQGSGSGLDADLLDGLDSSEYAKQSQLTGFKNYIINGGFDIWQRGESFPAGGTSKMTADRWKISSPGSVEMDLSLLTTNQGATGTTNQFKNRMTFTIPVGGLTDKQNFKHSIEDVIIFSGKTLTLSFWVHSANNINNLISVEAWCNFGDGGSTIVSALVEDLTEQTPGVWSKISKTFTVPDFSVGGQTIGPNNYLGLFLIFKNTFASDDYIQIANMQLEEGSVATPFEQRPVGLELSLCERTYQKGIEFIGRYYTSTTTSILPGTNLRTTMRATPTVTIYPSVDWTGITGNIRVESPGDGDYSVSMSSVTTQFFKLLSTGYSDYTNSNMVYYSWTASADLP